MSDTLPQDNVTPPITQTPPVVAPALEPAGQAPAQSIDPNSLFANQLAEIKNTDGRQKYADVQTALASVPHAQTHIDAQALEISTLKSELEQRKGMEAVLEQLQAQQSPTENPSVNGIDEATLASMLDAKLQERDEVQVASSNQTAVLKQLATKFGDKAEDRFTEKAKALGVSVGFLSDLARKAPDAVLAYFDTATPHVSNPTEGSINSHTLDNSPQPQNTDYMRIFQSGTSDNLAKWKAAAKT